MSRARAAAHARRTARRRAIRKHADAIRRHEKAIRKIRAAERRRRRAVVRRLRRIARRLEKRRRRARHAKETIWQRVARRRQEMLDDIARNLARRQREARIHLGDEPEILVDARSRRVVKRKFGQLLWPAL